KAGSFRLGERERDRSWLPLDRRILPRRPLRRPALHGQAVGAGQPADRFLHLSGQPWIRPQRVLRVHRQALAERVAAFGGPPLEVTKPGPWGLGVDVVDG